MIRGSILALLPLLFCQVAYADLAQDLRQLRNTISETSRTGKELGELAGVGNSNQQPPVQPNTGVQNNVLQNGNVNEGDILVGKIGNIKLFAEPSKQAVNNGTLTKHEEFIYTGTEVNGYYSVTTANKGDGWVEKVLVKKK
ncbi:MAG: hypothetical protein ACO1N8_07290 [Methylophilus sp.]